MGHKGYDFNKSHVPGPGAYAPDYQQLKEHHPSYKMGTESRNVGDRTSVREVPGPGNYNPKKRPISASPSYGFGSSYRGGGGKSTKDITPGPGYYRVPCRIQDVP